MMRALHSSAKGARMEIGILREKGVLEFVDTHAGALSEAMEQVEMSDKMRQHLEKSNYIFSGFKAFHELNEAFPSLLDDKGNKKPFERFLNDVQRVHKTYNQHYLRAEYNFVSASAEMAGRWEMFEKDGDNYLLQYRTVKDSRVRPEHAYLHEVTLPFSSPFWEQHFPPNGWNCRCTVVQVRKGKYKETDLREAQQRADKAQAKDKKGMFRFNAGKERKAIPDYNPYTISKCSTCPVAKGKGEMALAKIPDNELCQACKLIRECESVRFEVQKTYPNGGRIEKHVLVSDKDSDYGKLMEIAEFFAAQGKVVRLTPKMARPPKFVYQNIYGSLMGTKYEGKCPDLWIDGEWYEHEGFVTDNPKRALKNMLNHGLKQSENLIIDTPDLSERYMLRSILGHIERGVSIKEVWLKDVNGFLKILYKNTRG